MSAEQAAKGDALGDRMTALPTIRTLTGGASLATTARVMAVGGWRKAKMSRLDMAALPAHIFRPPTPIERMVDAATGTATSRVRRTVILTCPHCPRRMTVAMDPTDPPNTARISATCDRCPDDAAVIDYFNAQGQQIDLKGAPMKGTIHV